MPIKVHIPDVGAVNFPDGMSPDEIHTAVDSVYSQHIAANPPGMPSAPAPQMQQSLLGNLVGGPSDAPSSFNKVPQSIQNAPDSLGEAIGGTSLLGAAALGGAPVAKFAAQQFAKHPILGPTIASYAISRARDLPVLGEFLKHVPQAELIPWLGRLGVGSTAEAEGAAAGAKGEAAAASPPAATPAPTARPGPALESQLRDSLGGAEPLKPNVPLRQQMPATAAKAMPQGMTPVESSSVLKAFKYDPASQEMEVVTHGGGHYVYGDVSPEQAQTFVNSDSAGQAWNQLRQSGSVLTAKVINGKRIPVKPAAHKTIADWLTNPTE